MIPYVIVSNQGCVFKHLTKTVTGFSADRPSKSFGKTCVLC